MHYSKLKLWLCWPTSTTFLVSFKKKIVVYMILIEAAVTLQTLLLY